MESVNCVIPSWTMFSYVQISFWFGCYIHPCQHILSEWNRLWFYVAIMMWVGKSAPTDFSPLFPILFMSNAIVIIIIQIQPIFPI